MLKYILPDGYVCPLCGLLFYGNCDHSAVDIMIDAAEKINAQAAEIAQLKIAIHELGSGAELCRDTWHLIELEKNNKIAYQAAEIAKKDAEIERLLRQLKLIEDMAKEQATHTNESITKYDMQVLEAIARAARERKDGEG